MPLMCFVFKKKADTNIESLVQWWSGPMVHVEIVPFNLKIMFTSYMFETFSANKFSQYDPSKYDILALNLTEDEYDSMNKILVKFVEQKIPYNYSDILKLGTNTMFFDADDFENIEDIHTLFCSQAATFALKNALSKTNPAKVDIMQMNSRFTSPTALYETLKHYGEKHDSLYKKSAGP
jgi:hypothetical protein